jgi:hypothetical protein
MRGYIRDLLVWIRMTEVREVRMRDEGGILCCVGHTGVRSVPEGGEVYVF